MMMRWMVSATVAAGAMLIAGAASAQAMFPVKFTLDWKFQGPTAFFLIAADKGYYKAEGLDVTIDAGQGSAGAVTRVASGAYDLGFADINALIEYNAANPDKAIKSVMVIYDFPPFGVYSLKATGIKEPKDLEGKTLGAPVFDASYKLFPAFANKVGIDAAKVPRKNMSPELRETMLIQKQVDFISGHYFSSYFDLKAKGVKPEDMVVMRYIDYGLDFYGNGIIAAPKMIAEQPEKLRGFVRATMKGMRDMLKDPPSGIAATKKRDPLVDEQLELDRMKLAIEQNIMTPNVKRDGFGTIDMGRLDRAIDQVATSLGLPRKPAANEIFSDAFLPAKEQRMME
jgi:NitT/TauT family transport system substrate-binding protein